MKVSTMSATDQALDYALDHAVQDGEIDWRTGMSDFNTSRARILRMQEEWWRVPHRQASSQIRKT